MTDLPKLLRIKAGVIEMGERIAWGSDSALMREAADAIDRLLGTTEPDVTPDERCDAALESVLRAAGTSIKNYMPGTKDAMREAMRRVMSDSYIQGSNDCHRAHHKVYANKKDGGVS